MTTVAGRGWRWRVWRYCWVLWRLHIPRWRAEFAEWACWPAWRVRRWERKLAPQIAEQRGEEAEIQAEYGGLVSRMPLWHIKELHYPSRVRALCWSAVYRSGLWWLQAQVRYRVRRLRGTAKSDGRSYVGWTVRVVGQVHRHGLPVGTEGRVFHAMFQPLHVEFEHDIEFPDGRIACTPLPLRDFELVEPQVR